MAADDFYRDLENMHPFEIPKLSYNAKDHQTENQ